MLKNPKLHSGNVSACSLCLSCNNVCPTKVNPGTQIYAWRQQLDSLGTANPAKKLISEAMKVTYEHHSLLAAALKTAPIVNLLPHSLTENAHLDPWAVGHNLPAFSKESFETMWKKGKVK